jgi:hypothetical protein
VPHPSVSIGQDREGTGGAGEPGILSSYPPSFAAHLQGLACDIIEVTFRPPQAHAVLHIHAHKHLLRFGEELIRHQAQCCGDAISFLAHHRHVDTFTAPPARGILMFQILGILRILAG